MSEPKPTSINLAEIYKSFYEKELAAAPAHLRARVLQAKGNDTLPLDRDVTTFIQSVAFKAEQEYDKLTAPQVDKKLKKDVDTATNPS